MIATLAALLAAHFVADFVLQSDAMVARKRHPAVMARHILIVTATTALALGWLDGRILAWIAGTHLAMDMIKTWWLKPTLRAFAADQIFHLGVIAILAMLYPDATTRGVWTLLPVPVAHLVPLAMLGGATLIAATTVGGIVIGKLLDRIATTDTAAIQGLANGGLYIGWLERALTVLLVMIDQPSGVGLLLAAKSILRFGDISDTTHRARAEYIMIGTFLSVGWALCVAVAARKLAAHLPL